jgi:hypothetical protein
MERDGLLQRIASEEALWSAWDEVRLARGAPGTDGVSVREFTREAPDHLLRRSREIRARRYRPHPLRRVWVRKCGKENEPHPSPSPRCATVWPRALRTRCWSRSSSRLPTTSVPASDAAWDLRRLRNEGRADPPAWSLAYRAPGAGEVRIFDHTSG